MSASMVYIIIIIIIIQFRVVQFDNWFRFCPIRLSAAIPKNTDTVITLRNSKPLGTKFD